MALLCSAAGYRLSDLPEERDVLAINWRGMPMPPDVLVSRNKKIVHPVKDDDPNSGTRNTGSIFRAAVRPLMGSSAGVVGKDLP